LSDDVQMLSCNG